MQRLSSILLLLLGPALLWGQVIHSGISGDVFWQLAAGNWMWLHGHVITRDPFSFTLHGHHWVTEEWGFEVMLSGLWHALGPVAFWLIAAGWGTVALLGVFLRLRERGQSVEKSAIFLVLVALSLLPFLKDRPQMVSYAFLSLSLWILERARKHPRFIWGMLPMLWLWTNIHGSFLLGFLVLLLEAVWTGTRFPKRFGRFSIPVSRVSGKTLAAVFVLSVGASWINPNGPGLWVYSIRVSTSPVISRIIQEWQSPDFHVWLLLATITGPLILLIFAALLQNTKVSWPDFFLTGGFYVATLRSVRFLPYFALEWPMLAADLTPRITFRHIKSWVIIPAVGLVGVLLLTAQPIIPPGRPSQEPVAATVYLRQHPGRVFNAYHWGGFLIWRHIPVFVDGRTDLYLSSPILQDYLAVKQLTVNPETVFARYHIRYVLWPPGTPLSMYLLHSQYWRLVQQTPVSLLFKWTGPKGRVLIRTKTQSL